MRRAYRGIVQVYTGNGKGKTTAAIGLAVRAAGSGMRVSIHQFAKNGRYNELKALEKIGRIDVKQCGRRSFIKGKPSLKDIDCARRGLEAARRDIFSGRYDLVVLDEINIALKLGLIDPADALAVINGKPAGLELVLTGRCCPAAVLRKADLVTEMRQIRHPYKKGMAARRGIEY